MAFVEVNSTVIKDSETVTTLTLDPSADLTGFFPGENITEVGNGDDGRRNDRKYHLQPVK